MVMVNSDIRMVIFTEESLNKIKDLDKEFAYLKMEQHIKETGNLISLMDLALI